LASCRLITSGLVVVQAASRAVRPARSGKDRVVDLMEVSD
jgi:hypothetical protein